MRGRRGKNCRIKRKEGLEVGDMGVFGERKEKEKGCDIFIKIK